MQNANNYFDINKYCEDFFCDFLNALFDINLKNLNELKMNFPSVDLGDDEAGICYQVTSTNDIKKIKDTLEKFKAKKLYTKYDEINILILGKKKEYTSKIAYDQFDFDIKENVIDLKDLSRIINTNKNKGKINKIYELLKENVEGFGDIQSASYLASILIPEVRLGTYTTFMVKYLEFQTNSIEAEVTRNEINYFADKLAKLDTNTREVIKAIIDIGEVSSGRKKGIYFNRLELYKYLRVDRNTINDELRLLNQKNYIEPNADFDMQYDRLYGMSEGKDWDILFALVAFCFNYNRDISKLVLNLDFTILD